MLIELFKRLIILADIPDHELIVVAARGQNFIIEWAPSQTTDFLLVTSQLLDIISDSQVSHVDLLVFTSRGY